MDGMVVLQDDRQGLAIYFSYTLPVPPQYLNEESDGQ